MHSLLLIQHFWKLKSSHKNILKISVHKNIGNNN
jgi:hypothetical protein